jgi:hypothetical protein
MSDQQPPTTPEPRQHGTEIEPAGPAAAAPDRSGAPAQPHGFDRDQRKAIIAFGSLFAGAGFGIGFAVVIHMIAQANPAAFPNGGGGQVVLMILIVAPLIALGLGMLMAGLLPDDGPQQADRPAAQTAGPSA